MEYALEDLAYILQTVKRIAIVGLSAKPERPSYQVARYLAEQGYEIVPVNPAYPEVMGLKSYSSLFEVPGTIDLVDVFRRPEEALAVVQAAVQLQVPVVWLQEGVRNDEAVALGKEHGTKVVQDICIKKVHQALKSKGMI